VARRSGYTRIFVDGQWIASTNLATIAVENPATEQVIAEVPEGSVDDVEKAVAAAAAAFPSWSRTPPLERGKFVTLIGDVLASHADELAESICNELGCPRVAAQRQAEVPIEGFAAYAELASTFAWEESIGQSTVVRVPVGVVAAITPWNFPLLQVVDKIAPALVAGCTVILKPSEMAPLTAWAIADACEEVGLPPGVFNLVSGYGPLVGEALVRHPGVDMITFTGSTAAGQRIATIAAARCARVTLELGGKSANILLDDADLDVALPASVQACFFNSGQVCTALSRLLVPRAQYDEVVDRVKVIAEAVTVGDPRENLELGPLASMRQRERVRTFIEQGIAEGARLVTGGSQAPLNLDHGAYVRPTVFADVNNSMTIAREEIFGPVLTIIPYDDEEEAVAIANDSPYGLSGGVWSTHPDRALRVARQMRTGSVRINGQSNARGAPQGGFKQSGIGREKGAHGLEEFLELQTISMPPGL
jgi:acyl-CoA reductase-like NAD-dependent aldehyde dehydrogenase